MDLKPSLYGMTAREIADAFKEMGEPAYRSRQVLEWLYRHHAGEWKEFRNLPAALQDKLASHHLLRSLAFREAVPSSNGQSTKFLFETQDGHLLESVLITQQDRRTVCVSTQLGCKMKCAFCASGTSFGRNLTAGEIVEQAAWIERSLRAQRPRNDSERKITNIVYMGMGEPLDNLEATLKSLEIFQAEWGFALGGRRITVSTVGLVPKIEEFVQRADGRVRLSVSLHAGDDLTRSRIVPINRRYSLEKLSRSLQKVSRELRREITFEYTLLENINDTSESARGVVALARPLRAKINLIPYNSVSETNFKRPSKERIDAFRNWLVKGGLRVTVRQTAGRDINAACGQLRLDRERVRQKQPPAA